MYDAGKIIPGIIIFALLVTGPIWSNIAKGQADYYPEPAKPVAQTQCVESTDYMRTWHMDLLNTWRDEVVRGGDRIHRAPSGKTYNKSLTNTCMECHTRKSQFCDKCHDYAGVSNAIYCWECHVNPEEKH